MRDGCVVPKEGKYIPLILAALVAGVTLSYFNRPIFIWGATSASTFLDQNNFASLTSVVVDTYT